MPVLEGFDDSAHAHAVDGAGDGMRWLSAPGSVGIERDRYQDAPAAIFDHRGGVGLVALSHTGDGRRASGTRKAADGASTVWWMCQPVPAFA